MKICPQCQNTYTDDSLQFCLQDGAQLNLVNSTSQNPTAVWNDEPQTVVRDQHQMRINIQEPPQNQPPTYSTNPQTNFQNDAPPKSKAWLFILLGLLFLFVIGGIGAVGLWFYMNQDQTTIVQNNTNTASNSNSVFANTNTAENSNVNANLTPTATPTPTPKPTLKPAEIETAKKEAESVIDAWKTAAENHNLDTNLSNYADTVDYYKGGKIGKSKLKASKEPAYKRYDSIDIEISNMKVSVDATGEKATITLDKTWDFNGVDKDGNDVFNNGKVQQQLILNKFNGKWKIVSEKDVKVYYADKGASDDY